MSQRVDMSFWDDEKMHRGNWVDVVKGQHVLIFIHDFRWDRACRDLTENAIIQRRTPGKQGDGKVRRTFSPCGQPFLRAPKDLRGAEPNALHELFLGAAERPLLEVVMRHAEGNQSKAAEWLGINRNTLRRKLLDHKLIK